MSVSVRLCPLMMLVALAPSWTGCVTAGSRAVGMADGQSVVLEVDNRSWSDMTVYVSRRGTEYRLGRVTALSRKAFRLPRDLAHTGAALALLADPLGSDRRVQSRQVGVRDGDVWAWTLHVQAALSTLVAR